MFWHKSYCHLFTVYNHTFWFIGNRFESVFTKHSQNRNVITTLFTDNTLDKMRLPSIIWILPQHNFIIYWKTIRGIRAISKDSGGAAATVRVCCYLRIAMAADCGGLRSEIVSTETTSDQTDKSHTLRLKHRLLVIHHYCNLHANNQQHFVFYLPTTNCCNWI